MNYFINILAAFPSSGPYVNGQLYELATTLDVRPNRISFEDAYGLSHHILNCAVQTEAVTGDKAEDVTSPIVDKSLTTLVATLYDANGTVIREFKNVRDLDFDDPTCDVAFMTENDQRVTLSGSPIVIDEVWVDTLPLNYINDVTQGAIPGMVDRLFSAFNNTLKEQLEGELDEQITAQLPAKFVNHLLTNGNGFVNAHETLRVMLLPALYERLTSVYNGGNNGSDDESKRCDKYNTFAPLPADTTGK